MSFLEGTKIKRENIKLHSTEPFIFEVTNFFTEEECDTIIKASEEKMEKAFVGSYEKARESKIRTGYSHFLSVFENLDVFGIFKKITMFLNLPSHRFDQFFQVISYDKNQEYKDHLDPSFEKNKRLKIKHRLFTVLCYLNDVEEGGETYFPKLNISVKPQRGKIIYFQNYDKEGKVNKLSTHRSKPVTKGKKWAFNLWFHDKN